ncbi:MAG: hypothetical protein LUD71_03050 [Clostridiales bacterium]|nr:hypothetical protein [Clostridiales bacterium]
MDIYYENSAGDKVVLSEWPIAVTDVTQLFERKWESSATKNVARNRSVLQYLTRTEKEFPFNISIYADSKEEYLSIANNFNNIIDYDIRNESPGKLYVGEYYLRCFILESAPADYEELFYTVDLNLQVYSVEPHWIKETSFSFLENTRSEETSGIDYPYDYTYDYNSIYGKGYITNSAYSASSFLMIIYGYVVNPVITIGSHIYALDIMVLCQDLEQIKMRSFAR